MPRKTKTRNKRFNKKSKKQLNKKYKKRFNKKTRTRFNKKTSTRKMKGGGLPKTALKKLFGLRTEKFDILDESNVINPTNLRSPLEVQDDEDIRKGYLWQRDIVDNRIDGWEMGPGTTPQPDGSITTRPKPYASGKK